MDTKSKSNKIVIIIVIAVIAALVITTLATTAPIYKATALDTSGQANWYTDSLTREIYEQGYLFYWKLQEQIEGRTIQPAELYCVSAKQRLEELEVSRSSAEADMPDDPYSGYYADEYGSSPVERIDETAYNLVGFIETVGQTVNSINNRFNNDWNGTEYQIYDSDGNMLASGGADAIRSLLDMSADERDRVLESDYSFFVIVNYKSDGTASVAESYCSGGIGLTGLENYTPEWVFENAQASLIPSNTVSADPFGDMTVIYLIPKSVTGYNFVLNRIDNHRMNVYKEFGFLPLFLAAMLIIVLMAFIMSWRNACYLGVLQRIPFEFCCAIALLAVPAAYAGAYLLGHGVTGNLVIYYYKEIVFDSFKAEIICYSLAGVGLAVYYFAAFCAVYSIVQMRTIGIKEYFKTKSIIIRVAGWCLRLLGRIFRWIGNLFKKVYEKLSGFDLSEPGVKPVLRICLANFVVVTLLCCIWFGGIIGAVIYSIVLFYLLRKTYRRQHDNYEKLLKATGDLANGVLNVDISDDLGMFTSLGSELKKVQQGLSRAVAEEVKSHNMKTELVTNVSHDLKTPLTAIITYVDLLKNENITDEERRSYVETLDNKSQRLKALIDDLFEVSKAVSGNVELKMFPVDICSLIMQVEQEIETEITEANIEIIHRFPADNKLIARLDGEKCSRIFENLLINVTKYAMPGTRAYIEVGSDESNAFIEVKNMAKDMPEFNNDAITERFVRGDKSRSTNGSGLGLAIVKSFTELQGGTLQIITDGDLFKAVLSFPM